MNYEWNILNKCMTINEIGHSIMKWKNIPEGGMKDFINVDNIICHDPFLLTNIGKAVDRINLAIGNNEKICIIGD